MSSPCIGFPQEKCPVAPRINLSTTFALSMCRNNSRVLQLPGGLKSKRYLTRCLINSNSLKMYLQLLPIFSNCIHWGVPLSWRRKEYADVSSRKKNIQTQSATNEQSCRFEQSIPSHRSSAPLNIPMHSYVCTHTQTYTHTHSYVYTHSHTVNLSHLQATGSRTSYRCSSLLCEIVLCFYIA